MPVSLPEDRWPQTLVIEGYGTSATKRHERLVVRGWEDPDNREQRTEKEYPLRDLQEVIFLGGGVSLSTDLLQSLVQNQIAVCFVDHSGEPYALLSAPGTHATVATRRAQLSAMDTDKGAHLARGFVEGKIRNQLATVKYLAKNRTDQSCLACLEEARNTMTRILKRLSTLQLTEPLQFRQSLMSCEGAAAKAYWAAIGAVLASRVDFARREHQGAADPVNVCLNYGYGILYGRIWQAVIMAGLEPYAGFLHTDRPGKPSMVLDLAEEFRPGAVDRAVISFFTRGSSVQLDSDGRLDTDSRRRLARHVIEHMDARHPYQGKKHTLTGIMHQQARAVAAFLRGDIRAYRPFRLRW